jgi:hypothetical protein
VGNLFLISYKASMIFASFLRAAFSVFIAAKKAWSQTRGGHQAFFQVDTIILICRQRKLHLCEEILSGHCMNEGCRCLSIVFKALSLLKSSLDTISTNDLFCGSVSRALHQL